MKLIKGLAPRDSGLPLLVSQLLCFLGVQPSALRVVRDAVRILSGPFRDDISPQIFEDFLRLTFERVAIARPAAAETKQQVPFLIDLGGPGDQFIVPLAVDGALL